MSHSVLEDAATDEASQRSTDTATNGCSANANEQSISPLRRHLRRLRRGSLPHAWRTLGRSPLWGAICVGMIALAISMTLAFVRWPQPSVHDEFSYLLAADTFAHGRLANPAHPMGKFFESFHILQQPSYASKYQPGQGLMLALGQTLFGTPLAGVWISLALASMALFWMLHGWAPGRWALLGGLIFSLHTNIQMMWGHSYWGGAVAFTGGALLLGAMARLLNAPTVSAALIMACGALTLSITRPYEGFVLCCGVGSILLWQQIRGRLTTWKQFVLKVVLPAMIVLFAGITCLGIYNQAVTGSPFQMAYAVHEHTYGISPLFIWQSVKSAPEYAHKTMREFYQGWGLDAWRQHQTIRGFLEAKLDALFLLWTFFFGAILSLPLIAAPRVLGDLRLRYAWMLLSLMLGASMLVFWTLPHYFAPAAPLLFLVLLQAVRRLRASAKRGWPVARYVPGMLLATQLVLLLTATFNLAINPSESWADERAAFQHELSHQPGEHLILVQYDPEHNVHEEWVYNGADLQHAKVLWARDIDPAANQPLLDHYSQRHIWKLMVSPGGQRLEKLPQPEESPAPSNPFENEE